MTSPNNNTPAAPVTAVPRVFSPAYRWLSLGLYMAIVAGAFDQTAVTAIMPTIANDFGDPEGFAAAFVLPMSFSIMAMVAAGMSCTRFGSPKTLKIGLVVLCIGLLMSIVAWSMPIFLVSRAFQGVGIGTIIVAVYATIAHAYPVAMRTAVFAGFSAAWLLPALLGPMIAGALTTWFSWHAVFGITAVIVVIAYALLMKPLAAIDAPQHALDSSAKSQVAAGVLVAIVCATLTAANKTSPWIAVLITLVALVLLWRFIRPLVPKNFFRADTTVSRLIASRGALDSLMAAEIYLPLLLSQRDGFGPTLTGIGLSVSGFTWFIGSTLQAKVSHRVSYLTTVKICIGLASTGLALMIIPLLLGLHAVVIIAGWGVISAGIGFLYPRISGLPLEVCKPQEIGFMGASVQVVGQTSMAVMTALCALMLHATAPLPTGLSFAIMYLLFGIISIPVIAGMWLTKLPKDIPAKLAV